MRPYDKNLDGFKISGPRGEVSGAYKIPFRGTQPLRVIASDGLGWDHVSVSLPNRCPTWEEMCYVKGLFWADDEWVLQYHPAKADYVNFHPFALHMWKPQGVELPTPPRIAV